MKTGRTIKNTGQSRVHYEHGCWRVKYEMLFSSPILTTNRFGDVTCGTCLGKIRKLRLKPKILFPEVPTFEVTATEPIRKLKDTNEWTTRLMFACPVCGQKNYHCGTWGKIGKGDGHRVSHCPCWDEGYYIKEVEKKC